MKKSMMVVLMAFVGIVLVASSLSYQEIQSAQLRREEEKMAHDLYMQFSQKWGIPTFYNFSRSKAKHLESTYDELFRPYNLEDPIQDLTIGTFTNPEIKAMYEDYLEKGFRSPQDAIEVVMMILDMDLLHRAAGLAFGQDEEFLEVFEHRTMAAENQIRAMHNQALRYGLTYHAQFIPQERMDSILAVARDVMGGGGGQRVFGVDDRGPFQKGGDEDCDCDDCH
jgi:hypothetical protein